VEVILHFFISLFSLVFSKLQVQIRYFYIVSVEHITFRIEVVQFVICN